MLKDMGVVFSLMHRKVDSGDGDGDGNGDADGDGDGVGCLVQHQFVPWRTRFWS